MKKFAVIGDPISHSLSPIMHRWIFNELNINATYEKIHVRKNNLNEIINKIHNGVLDGINVTLPHKSSIISHMDKINPRAKCPDCHCSSSFLYKRVFILVHDFHFTG